MRSQPLYYTERGQAYVGDSLTLLGELPDGLLLGRLARKMHRHDDLRQSTGSPGAVELSHVVGGERIRVEAAER